jgi:aquaporin Z
MTESEKIALPTPITPTKKYIAELVGTMVLVLMGCGSAVIAGNAIGFSGISFAFGLSVVAMAYAIGTISGCHINPAISIAMGGPSFNASNLGQNGYDLASPAGYSLVSALIAEIVLTFIFVLVVFGSTSERAPKGFAGLAIGLTLVLIHLVAIPIDGTSVNPARSLGPALLAGISNSTALSQLWLFIVAPIIGGILAAIVWKVFKQN